VVLRGMLSWDEPGAIMSTPVKILLARVCGLWLAMAVALFF
jgi:hypothetical protein